MSVTLNPHASAASIMEMPMVEIERLSFWYGAKQALKDVAMSVSKHRITASIGPSGCGKSTLLRCLNRMNDLVDGARMEGTIRIGGTDIYDPALDVTELRKRVGMVFVTTLLLLAIVVLMNLFAIRLRNRLRRTYAMSAV